MRRALTYKYMTCPHSPGSAGLVPHCAHRPSTFLSCAVCERSFDFISYFLCGRCSLSQGGDCVSLTARVHRAHSDRARCASKGTCSHVPALRPHTGHSSSFHAISQNIHSYRELIMNASSIRFFSACPASFTHPSTFARIHLCTSANSGEA
jgi:hypothetical protein